MSDYAQNVSDSFTAEEKWWFEKDSNICIKYNYMVYRNAETPSQAIDDDTNIQLIATTFLTGSDVNMDEILTTWPAAPARTNEMK